tara:strand:- start:18113 stop:18703 length:591 start_codon:yes stop_codon:yes gene_type:complete
MKKIALTICTILILSAFTFIYVDTCKAYTKTSQLVWRAEKVNAKQFGNVKIESDELRNNYDGRFVDENFIINMSSITNLDIESNQYKAMLVDYLKSSKFFDVDKYLKAIFKLIRSTPLENKFNLLRQLNIRGNIGPINIPIHLENQDNGNIIVSRVCRFNRTKFGLIYGSNSFFNNLRDEAISSIINLEFEIVLEK